MAEFRGGDSFLTAIQTNVEFNGADPTDSQFYKSNLARATFEGAVIAGAWFAEATTSATTLIGAFWVLVIFLEWEPIAQIVDSLFPDSVLRSRMTPMSTVSRFLCVFGTDLVRPRERSSKNWGISGTLDAELE